MVCIVISSRKGGSGKSCTSASLFSWIVNFTDKKALLIDTDSQSNSSYALGIDVVATPNITTIADVFAGNCTLEDAMQKYGERGYIIPGHVSLVDFDNGRKDFKVNLKNELKSLSKKIDYVIIDTPPSLGKLTLTALLSGDKLVIPCQADVFSIQGINDMINILKIVYPHNKIKTAGILLTRNNERLLLTKMLSELFDEKAKELNSKVFKSTIREGVAVREAAAQQLGLFQYDPKLRTNVAQDYDRFAKELLGV